MAESRIGKFGEISIVVSETFRISVIVGTGIGCDQFCSGPVLSNTRVVGGTAGKEQFRDGYHSWCWGRVNQRRALGLSDRIDLCSDSQRCIRWRPYCHCAEKWRSNAQTGLSALVSRRQTGEVKDSREFVGFGVRAIFATNDAHVIVSGASVLRLTPDLKDDGSFDYYATGQKHGRVQNVSPDGSTLGNATSPGFELINAQNLKATELTANASVDTSVNNKGFVTDNVHWISDYPKVVSFITYTDATGGHLLYHGKCGGRPQFLSDELVLEPGCKSPLIVDTRGNLIRTLSLKGEFSYAGVSQNGKRFALQVASFSGMHSLKQERFVIYSVETWEPVAEVLPDELAEEQSWTAFSPDGSMIVVGSPLKLTLYRLP